MAPKVLAQAHIKLVGFFSLCDQMQAHTLSLTCTCTWVSEQSSPAGLVAAGPTFTIMYSLSCIIGVASNPL